MNAAEMTYEDVVVQVREAWAEVLGNDSAEEVPLDVNFLEVGGNSLLLVMLWEQLQPIAARPVKLSELFHHGTVHAQAELLTGRADAPGADAPAGQSGARSLLAQRRAAAVTGGGA